MRDKADTYRTGTPFSNVRHEYEGKSESSLRDPEILQTNMYVGRTQHAMITTMIRL